MASSASRRLSLSMPTSSRLLLGEFGCVRMLPCASSTGSAGTVPLFHGSYVAVALNKVCLSDRLRCGPMLLERVPVVWHAHRLACPSFGMPGRLL